MTEDHSIAEAIKSISEHQVQVKTGYQMTAQILVQVVPEDIANQRGELSFYRVSPYSLEKGYFPEDILD